MRVPLKWLSEYVDLPDIPIRELADRLTLAGLEVEGMEDFGPLSGVVVGRVVAVEHHPHSDHLFISQVDVGDKVYTVVCGARNLTVGKLVPLALPGARLPQGSVNRTTIRGVESFGMILSKAEVGLPELESQGIWNLSDNIAPGTDFSSIVEAPDIVLILKITSNRPDLLGIYGVAREVAALFDAELRPLDLNFPEGEPETSACVQVGIEDPRDSPRYIARLILDVNFRPSPAWMEARLAKAGMRPVSWVVDATNYVMLELGQPLHAFDYDRLSGGQIYVRRAQPGEYIRTLDGVDRVLSPDVLVITDGGRPVAVAGVIGGEETEISAATKAVLLEAACFSPVRIRRSSRALGLRTEASLRFERGLAPELPDLASRRCCALLSRHGGFRIAKGAVDFFPAPRQPQVVTLRKAKVGQILGVEVPEAKIARILSALGMQLQDANDRFVITVPPYRGDIRLEIDLIEEVARLYGYDRIPASAPRVFPRVGKKDPREEFGDRVRKILAALGLTEVCTGGFVPKDQGEVVLRNPMAQGQEALRASLLPGLLSVVRTNLEAQESGMAIFEIGRVFQIREGEILEEDRLGVALSGRPPIPISGKADYTPADLRGVLDATLAALRIKNVSLRPSNYGHLHPFRQAAIVIASEEVGWLGEISPSLSQELPAERRVLAMELSLAPLSNLAEPPSFQPLPRFPVSKRDLSVLVPHDLPEAEVRAHILAEPEVASCFLYDVYQGPGIPEGQRSLTYEISFRHPERTLSSEEVQEAVDRILSRLAPLGVFLRSRGRLSST